MLSHLLFYLRVSQSSWSEQNVDGVGFVSGHYLLYQKHDMTRRWAWFQVTACFEKARCGETVGLLSGHCLLCKSTMWRDGGLGFRSLPAFQSEIVRDGGLGVRPLPALQKQAVAKRWACCQVTTCFAKAWRGEMVGLVSGHCLLCKSTMWRDVGLGVRSLPAFLKQDVARRLD